jgi:hypothetical protein
MRPRNRKRSMFCSLRALPAVRSTVSFRMLVRDIDEPAMLLRSEPADCRIEMRECQPHLLHAALARSEMDQVRAVGLL